MPLFPEPWRAELHADAIAALPDRYPGIDRVSHPSLPAAGPPPIHATHKAAEWRAAIHRAWAYVAGRTREASHQAELAALLEQTRAAGPDFAKVRRNATFAPVPVVAYSPKAAREIMRQAREIERETHASRAKGAHGGALGRMAVQLLEWFAFTQWPKSGRFGMVPSLAHIADGARMSRATVVEAMRRLEAFGLLAIQRRRKRVETPLGAKVVQATNAYVLSFARGLATLVAFGKKPVTAADAKPAAGSEFRTSPAIRDDSFYLTSLPKNWLPKQDYQPLLE